MSQDNEEHLKIPLINRNEINKLISRHREAGHKTIEHIQKSASFEKIDHIVSDSNSTIYDILRIGSWHFWKHHRN